MFISVLIETMRREGYELQVGQPQVIYKEIDGVKCEPVEELTINVPEEFASKMIDMVTRRKGDMTSMLNMGDRVDIEFDIPSRGIIGLRTNVLTASQGEAIMAHRFKEYQPYKGEISRRSNGIRPWKRRRRWSAHRSWRRVHFRSLSERRSDGTLCRRS